MPTSKEQLKNIINTLTPAEVKILENTLIATINLQKTEIETINGIEVSDDMYLQLRIGEDNVREVEGKESFEEFKGIYIKELTKNINYVNSLKTKFQPLFSILEDHSILDFDVDQPFYERYNVSN